MPLEESPHEALTDEHRLLHHLTALLTISVEVLLVLGNLLPPLVVFRAKASADRTNLDLIVAALSLTDILSVVVPEPPWIAAYLRGSWRQDAVACNLHQLTALWFQLASMLIVVLLVLDRARSAKRMLTEPMPLPVDTRNSVLLGCLLLTCFCLTLLAATLPLLGFAPSAVTMATEPGGELTSGFCVSWLARRPASPRESVFFVVFASVGSLCVAGVLCTNLIIICMWQRKQAQAQKASAFEEASGIGVSASAADLLLEEEQYQEMGRFIQTMRVTALISLVFCCTWIPTLVLTGLQFANLSVSPPLVMYAQLSTTLSGVFNPLIYAVCSQSYREGYLRVLCGCCGLGGGCCYGGGGRAPLSSSDDDEPIDLPASAANSSGIAGAGAVGAAAAESGAVGMLRDHTAHTLLPHSNSGLGGGGAAAPAAGGCYAQIGHGRDSQSQDEEDGEEGALDLADRGPAARLRNPAVVLASHRRCQDTQIA